MIFFFLCMVFVSVFGQGGVDDKSGCQSKLAMTSCMTKSLFGGILSGGPNFCERGTEPTCGDDNCYSCISRNIMTTQCKDMPTETCAQNTLPDPVVDVAKRSVCLSCIPNYVPTCTRDTIKTCLANLKSVDSKPPVCSADEVFSVKDCCPSCVPKTYGCTLDQYKVCAQGYKSLPECDDTITRGDDCCQTCRRPIKVAYKRATAAVKCAKNIFKQAIHDLRDCEMGEQPVIEKDLLKCAASCRRPSSKYRLKDVVECLKTLPTCEEGETPEFLPEERCVSCRMGRPTCTAACADGELCVRRWNKEDKTMFTKCAKKGTLKLKLKAKAKAFAGKLKALTKEEVTKVIGEMIERYCERNDVAENCKRFKRTLVETLKCIKKAHEGAEDAGSEVLELEFATEGEEVQSTTARRLLQASGDATTLLEEASQDSEDIDGTTVAITTDDGSSASKTVASLFIIMTSLFGVFTH